MNDFLELSPEPQLETGLQANAGIGATIGRAKATSVNRYYRKNKNADPNIMNPKTKADVIYGAITSKAL